MKSSAKDDQFSNLCQEKQLVALRPVFNRFQNDTIKEESEEESIESEEDSTMFKDDTTKPAFVICDDFVEVTEMAVSSWGPDKRVSEDF